MGPDDGLMIAIGRMLRHTATVLRPTRSRDAGGGRRAVWNVVQDEVPCLAASMSMSTVTDQEGRLASDTSRSVYFLPDADIRQGDALSLRSRDHRPMGVHLVEAVDRQGHDVYLKAQARGQQPGFSITPGAPVA